MRIATHGGCLDGQSVDVSYPPPFTICADPPLGLHYDPREPVAATVERPEPDVYRLMKRTGTEPVEYLYVLAGQEPPL